mgnify:FL=1
MTGAAGSLEVGEIMIVPWDDMVHIGCSGGTTLVLELTSFMVSCHDGPSKGRPIWW